MPFQQDLNDKEQDHEREMYKYQNTYRLEPYNPFKVDLVDKIVQTILSNKLDNVSYDAAECPKLCELVATDIREKIKKLNFDRYTSFPRYFPFLRIKSDHYFINTLSAQIDPLKLLQDMQRF